MGHKLKSGIALAAGLLGVTLAGSAMAADQCVIKVARITPVTGALAAVAKDAPWVDENKIGPINKAGGLKVGNQQCKIEYKIYDSKSTVAGSADAATRAILQDKVDFLMAQGTPDTTNAPSDLCERNQIPCVMVNTPVEAWLFGPDGKPKTYKYTYAFFFSVVDLVKNHIGMIKTIKGGFNGNIGYLYPNDPDGTVFAQLFDPAFKQEGWKPTDPGRFQQGLPDFCPSLTSSSATRLRSLLVFSRHQICRTTCSRPLKRAISRRCT